jgi:hypothetical protein
MKVRAFVLTSVALSATAFAQLGGAVGSVTHAGGNLGGNTGSLGVDHTLNGTLDAGRGSLAGDLSNTTNAAATTDAVGKTKNKTKDVAGKTKDKSKLEQNEARQDARQRVSNTKQRVTPRKK